MKKTKIVCTLGPATDDDNILRELIKSGMDCARFNFSHGTHEDHKRRYDQVERIRKELNLPIPTILDTKGPEVRIKSFKDGKPVELKNGSEYILTTEDVEGDETRASINYQNLADDIETGVTILIDDGLLELKVTEIDRKENGSDIRCKVIHGGMLKPNKSCNFPGIHLSMPYLSERDKSDLLFGIKTGFDIVAASFVTCDEDIIMIRKLLDENGGKDISIIAKIENQDGVNNIDDILRVADGIMVARGDMGVEIPFIKLPEIQKTLIRKCVARGKYVITATQMLESMTTSPRPTRAEISDVANAVYDGTSAVMLSAESAAGKYPVESVKALDAICTEAERNGEFTALHEYIDTHSIKDKNAIRGSICKAAKEIAAEVGAKAIIVESATGRVARAMTHFRPDVPIIAVVTSQLVCRKLCLNWGVTALIGEEKRTSDAITKQAMEKALSTGLVHKGDTVVVLSSNRTCPTSSTDSLNIRIL